jgi:hypothetical protein
MADNADFTTTGKLLECNGADAMPMSCAQVIPAEINDAIVADVDAMMGKARSLRRQVIAVTELNFSCHAGSSQWNGV